MCAHMHAYTYSYAHTSIILNIIHTRTPIRAHTTPQDVIYLARDYLRMAQQIECADDEVRQMAEYLQQQQRLAVWNASDTASGIVLTRGGHCATKVGNTLCCSTRAMVPILRNRYIYFQMSILGDEDTVLASLSAGVSTSQVR